MGEDTLENIEHSVNLRHVFTRDVIFCQLKKKKKPFLFLRPLKCIRGSLSVSHCDYFHPVIYLFTLGLRRPAGGGRSRSPTPGGP